MNKKKGLFILGAAAVVVVILIVVLCGKPTVNLNKYVTISAEGYDTMGTLVYNFDYDAYEKDFSGKIKISDKNEFLSGWADYYSESAERIMLETCVSYDIDKVGALSNGDVVTLRWDCQDEMAEEVFNTKLQYEDITYEVEGLKEVIKFDPFDYVTVSFTGVDPYGEAVFTTDTSRPEMQDIQFTADNNGMLKEGDKVKVTVTTTGSLMDFVEKYGSRPERTEETYTVEGLDKIADFNPFDYVAVNFSGEDGDGKLTIVPDTSRQEMQDITFEADKYEGLKEGETVKITASLKVEPEEFSKKYGAALSKTEETYTVNGLILYVTEFDQIPEETYEKMDKQLQDYFNAYAAKEWKKPEQHTLTLNRYYLLTLKEGMDESPRNYLYLVYKVNYSNDEVKDFTYYWYGYYTDLKLLPDGRCSVDLSQYTVSKSESNFFSTSGDYLSVDGHYFVAGYKEIDSLFENEIVSKMEYYDYQELKVESEDNNSAEKESKNADENAADDSKKNSKKSSKESSKE